MSLGVRWTIGDVDPRGFEALRLSIHGAWRRFGSEASYGVCFNTLPLEELRSRVGPLPVEVRWIRADDLLPEWLRSWFDEGLGEGMAWKLAPPRIFPDRHELSLDNDCILWEVPEAVDAWLHGRCDFVVAEDVKACFGQFEELCGPAPRNLGIRGLPPDFDLEAALRRLLERQEVKLQSELDEQGMQLATLLGSGTVGVVQTREVTICSPFFPQQPWLGTCGAHFVGLNARALPWHWYDRPATACVVENWERYLPELRRRTGAGDR